MENKFFRFERSDIFLIFVLFLANSPALIFWFVSGRFLANGVIRGDLAAIIAVNGLLWIISIILILYNLKKRDLLIDYYQAWRKQSFLVAFIFVSFISIFWSISPIISAYKVLILLASSLLGSFIGLRVNLSRWLTVLFWFGAVLLMLSAAFALIFPNIGTMPFYPYDGAWRGIYWHRNHLGSILALMNVVFLVRMLSGFQVSPQRAILDGVFYLFSILIVYLAASAAGYILVFVLNFSIAITVVWLKIYPRLRKVHYLGIMGLLVIAAVLVAANLEFIFGLLNRTTSLTGRIPMWAYLFQNVISRSPWLGYGYGALWATASFCIGLSKAVGWSSPVVIGDNGFIDILLHVGVVGIIPFLGVFVLAWVRSFKYALARRTLIGFSPLIIMLFVLLANISFSLFLEIESFVWLLMVAVLFLPFSRDEQPTTLITGV